MTHLLGSTIEAQECATIGCHTAPSSMLVWADPAYRNEPVCAPCAASYARRVRFGLDFTIEAYAASSRVTGLDRYVRGDLAFSEGRDSFRLGEPIWSTAITRPVMHGIEDYSVEQIEEIPWLLDLVISLEY